MAVKSIPLKVIGVPDNNSAFANQFFISKEDQAVLIESDQPLLQVGNYVYPCAVSPACAKGCLALNSAQRKILGTSINDDVIACPFRGTQFLAKLSIEVSNNSTDMVVLEEDAFVGVIKGKFGRFPFSLGQMFLMDHKGAYLTLTVRACDMQDHGVAAGDEQKGPAVGTIDKQTIVRVTGAQQPKLRVVPSQTEARNILSPDFKFADMGIGGLDAEFERIFRRAFASRTLPPAQVKKLGLHHVKGMLLYGPPGTGKTLIARQIGKMLTMREPTVVNGPEILNKFVGQSEENIRKLFEPAEADYKKNGENADLHIIVFDEIDAICKQRGSVNSGAGVHDTVVNQLLSKIDGVNSLNNILVIGLTNRKDLIDEAILRAGRLEVHVEIGLPDEAGRFDIFKIHTRQMRETGAMDKNFDFTDLAHRTENFSGAEIETLVKAAQSFMINSTLDVIKDKVSQSHRELFLTREHFEKALLEVKPAFGSQREELETFATREPIHYSPAFTHVWEVALQHVKKLKESPTARLNSILFRGEHGCGSTALATRLALESSYPFIKVIHPALFVGYSEEAVAQRLLKVFDDAHKSPLSLIVLDDIERLLMLVNVGGVTRFSNVILQTLLVLIKKTPPIWKREKGDPQIRKELVLATTCEPELLEQMGFGAVFNFSLDVPVVETTDQLAKVLGTAPIDQAEKAKILGKFKQIHMGIKPLLLCLDIAGGEGQITCDSFMQACDSLMHKHQK